MMAWISRSAAPGGSAPATPSPGGLLLSSLLGFAVLDSSIYGVPLICFKSSLRCAS